MIEFEAFWGFRKISKLPVNFQISFRQIVPLVLPIKRDNVPILELRQVLNVRHLSPVDRQLKRPDFLEILKLYLDLNGKKDLVFYLLEQLLKLVIN